MSRQYAIRCGDDLIFDPSWTSEADVVASHAAFCPTRRMDGELLYRVDPDGEWRPVHPDALASERADVLERFRAELAKATGDGSKKRQAGTKPPWYEDDSHEGAIFSHLTKWKRGELVDPDSGAHPLVHAAWRCLAIACRETGNTPLGAQS